jgi:tRNA pseudouridine55 synthase
MIGILPIDKPAGISSARAVSRIKRLLPKGVKIGHAGTLDPFATGLLLLLIGKATKLCEQLMDEPKQYEGTIKFGANTPTDDPDSPEQPHAVPAVPSITTIEVALQRFIGEIRQRPPVYSALKIKGRCAYDLARQGQPVEMPPRAVRVYAITPLDYAWPRLTLRIDCGRGTYIRALARDLGEALGVGGYLTSLRRTRIGEFAVSESLTLEQVALTGVEPLLKVGHHSPH